MAPILIWGGGGGGDGMGAKNKYESGLNIKLARFGKFV